MSVVRIVGLLVFMGMVGYGWVHHEDNKAKSYEEVHKIKEQERVAKEQEQIQGRIKELEAQQSAAQSTQSASGVEMTNPQEHTYRRVSVRVLQ